MVINKQAMRKSNEISVIKHVINYGPISRSQISKDLSINKVTISSILDDLLAKKYVKEIGEGESTIAGGRRPLLVSFNSEYGYFINLEMGTKTLKIMATLANGYINRFEEIALSAKSSNIKSLLQKKITDFSVPDTQKGLLGISLTVHKKEQLLSDSLASWLKENYSIPVIVANNADAAAIFQRDFSSNNEIKDLITIVIDETINAGIIINENLYTGFGNNAGDLSEMQFLVSSNETIASFNPDTYCSQEAVLKSISKNEGLNNISIQEIAKLYFKGNKQVNKSISQFVKGLALVLNNLIAVFSPQMIILDSTLLENIPNLLIQVKNNLPILRKHHTQLQIARKSRFAPLLGGYSLLLREVFNLGNKRLRLIP